MKIVINEIVRTEYELPDSYFDYWKLNDEPKITTYSKRNTGVGGYFDPGKGSIALNEAMKELDPSHISFHEVSHLADYQMRRRMNDYLGITKHEERRLRDKKGEKIGEFTDVTPAGEDIMSFLIKDIPDAFYKTNDIIEAIISGQQPPAEEVAKALKELKEHESKFPSAYAMSNPAEYFAELASEASGMLSNTKGKNLGFDPSISDKFNKIFNKENIESFMGDITSYKYLRESIGPKKYIKGGGAVDTGLGFSLFGPKAPKKDLSKILFGPKPYKEKTFMDKMKELLFGKPMPPEVKAEIQKRVESGFAGSREKTIAERFKPQLFGPKLCGGGLLKNKYKAGGEVDEEADDPLWFKLLIGRPELRKYLKFFVKSNIQGVIGTGSGKKGTLPVSGPFGTAEIDPALASADDLRTLTPFLTGEALERFKMQTFGMGGIIRRKYQAGGQVKRYEQGPGGAIYEVDEQGNILRTVKQPAETGAGREVPVGGKTSFHEARPLPESFFNNKAYMAMQGEVDVEQPRVHPQDIAMFAEESATMTGRRFAEEARGLYRKRVEAAEKSRVRAAEIADMQRENREFMERDPRVREALRYPGLTGSTAELGLFNLDLDERTGLVGDAAIGKKYQSYYDLRELQYKGLKERIEKGELGFFQNIFKPAPGAFDKGLTVGYQPQVKKYFDERQRQKEALRSRLMESKPGEKVFDDAATIFGGTTAKALTMYDKLRRITSDPNFFSRYDEKQQSLFLSKLDEAGGLLSGPITSEKDREKLRQLLRNRTIDTAFMDLTGRDLSKAFTEKQHQAFKDIVERAKTAEDRKAAKQLMSGNVTEGVINDLLERGLLRKSDASFQTLQSIAARDISEEINAREKAKFAPKQSLTKYHTGGVVPTTGPIFAQAGEVILPRGFQEGGAVGDAAVLRSTTIKIDSSGIADEIAAQIKSAIEGTEIRIDEDAKVKVDVTDVVIPVDVGEAKVPVDTTDAKVSVDTTNVVIPIDDSSIDASAIGEAIASAIGTVKVDVSGSSVGADRFDQQSETISKLDDRILEIKESLDVKIKSAQTETLNSVRTEVIRQVESALNNITQDISKHENLISRFNSDLTLAKHSLGHRIEEVSRTASDGWTRANRPPTNTLI